MIFTCLKLKKTVIYMLIILCICLYSGPISAQKTDEVENTLSNLEKKYAGKSFVARFSQISKLAALDITDKASGTVSFSHPGKMKWEYREPETHQIITNGKRLWIFRPEENQVMTGDATQFFKSGAGGAFLSDISLIRKSFDIRLKETATHYIELDLTRKKKTGDITSIIIRVSKETFEITRVVTYNQYDDTTLLEFYDTRFIPLDPGAFEFPIPPGVNIIDMK